MHLALHNKLTYLSGRCHLVRRCGMDTVLEGLPGDVAHEGRTVPIQISSKCWAFIFQNLLMNVAYFPLLSKPGTEAKEQKQKCNCFVYCTPSPHHFSHEALTGEAIFPLLKASTALNTSFYADHVIGGKRNYLVLPFLHVQDAAPNLFLYKAIFT